MDDDDKLFSVSIEWKAPQTASMIKHNAEPVIWRRKLKDVGEAVLDHAIENGAAEVTIKVWR